MPLKFYWASVPVAMVLATIYLYYVVEYKPSQKRAKLFEVVHRPSECELTAGEGDLLHVHYTSFLKNAGKQFETTKDSEPYVFKLGKCGKRAKPECMKGFQSAVTGMCTGEKRKVTIPAKLGYDKKVRPKEIEPDERIVKLAMGPSTEQVRLPALGTSASAVAVGQKQGANEGELVRAASQADLRSSKSTPKPKTGLVTVKFRGDHGISFEGTRVSHSVLQAWMLGVRPGWTALSVDGQAVQTKEDIEDALQAAVCGLLREGPRQIWHRGHVPLVIAILLGCQVQHGQAKEKAERAKRQLAKLRKEFRFQGWIERAEHRGTTLAQIERVFACLEENCSAWVDHLPAKMLRIDFLNFYHLSNYLILPLTKPRHCSFVEMMTNQAQTPSWFLSHWWGTPVQGFVESVGKHAATRGLSADSSYWTPLPDIPICVGWPMEDMGLCLQIA
eukprot:symbB.v1.2.028846.t1/scaffold3093.1/size63743/6